MYYIYLGMTTLHASAANGYTWLVKYLLEEGADVNALSRDGEYFNYD